MITDAQKQEFYQALIDKNAHLKSVLRIKCVMLQSMYRLLMDGYREDKPLK